MHANVIARSAPAQTAREERISAFSSRAAFVVTLAVIAGILLLPDTVLAQDAKARIAQKGQDSFDLVYVGVYSLCSICLLGAFVGALGGRVEWSRFGLVAFGTIGVTMIAALVQFLQA